MLVNKYELLLLHKLNKILNRSSFWRVLFRCFRQIRPMNSKRGPWFPASTCGTWWSRVRGDETRRALSPEQLHGNPIYLLAHCIFMWTVACRRWLERWLSVYVYIHTIILCYCLDRWTGTYLQSRLYIDIIYLCILDLFLLFLWTLKCIHYSCMMWVQCSVAVK